MTQGRSNENKYYYVCKKKNIYIVLYARIA